MTPGIKSGDFKRSTAPVNTFHKISFNGFISQGNVKQSPRTVSVDLQQEALLEVRLAGTGNRLGPEPLTAEVQVEPEGGAHLARQRLWLLEVLQKGLPAQNLEVEVSSGWVHVRWKGVKNNHRYSSGKITQETLAVVCDESSHFCSTAAGLSQQHERQTSGEVLSLSVSPRLALHPTKSKNC